MAQRLVSDTRFDLVRSADGREPPAREPVPARTQRRVDRERDRADQLSGGSPIRMPRRYKPPPAPFQIAAKELGHHPCPN
jgi:hypothetical protein